MSSRGLLSEWPTCPCQSHTKGGSSSLMVPPGLTAESKSPIEPPPRPPHASASRTRVPTSPEADARGSLKFALALWNPDSEVTPWVRIDPILLLELCMTNAFFHCVAFFFFFNSLNGMVSFEEEFLCSFPLLYLLSFFTLIRLLITLVHVSFF